jgi:tol-pal system protein YbgF
VQQKGAAVQTRRGRGGGAAGAAAAPLHRPVLAVVVLALAASAGGCATKKDVRLLSDQVLQLQARQDSLYLELLGQNRRIADTLRAHSELMLRVRGDLGHQLLELGQQLVQVQELVGQHSAVVGEMQRQLERSRQEFLAGPRPDPGTAAGGDPAAGDQLYEVGMEQIGRGNASTARGAFQQLLQEFPDHPRAADAQYQLGETFLLERPPQHQQAVEQFDRVVQLFPDSPRAPAALFRAGIVLEQQGNNRLAQQYFQKVVSGYPGSDEARLAREKLGR